MDFNIDSVILISFLVINLIAGLFFSRGIKDIKEYAVGDRNFSTTTLTATIVATLIGGGFFYGSISQTYKNGLWHIMPRIGDVLTLLLVGYIIVPRMKQFLGKISVAEIMGELYGNKVRFITAIASILVLVGYVAVQIKVLIGLFYHFFGVSSIYATLLASMVITMYSTIGGIKAVTFTDVIQFFTFGVFVPIFTIFVWSIFDNPYGSIIASTASNPLFSVDTIFNFNDPKFYGCFTLFLYYAIPCLEPAVTQRILMAKNVNQARNAFAFAAFICFIMGGLGCVIGTVMLAHNPNLNPDSLVTYVVDNYSYTGLKGLTVIGILAMTMSSADSCINAAAVTFAHDLMRSSRNALHLSRIFAMFIGIFATILALSTNSLYDLLLLTGNVYIPVVTMPLLLAIFGFRTTPRVALIAMTAGITTVITLRIFIESLTGVDSIIPGMIANAVAMLLSHYLLNEDGGWVKNSDQERGASFAQTFASLKRHFQNMNFDLISYSKSNTPNPEISVVYSIFSAISLAIVTLSIDRAVYAQYFQLINILIAISFSMTTILICQGLWNSDFREKYIGIIWVISIFTISAFISSFLVLVSNFNSIAFATLILNLAMIGILLRWLPTLIIITSGFICSFIFYHQAIGVIHISTEPADLRFKMIYMLFMISAVLIAFFKPKEQYQDLTEESNLFLSDKVSDQKIELTKLYGLKNEFLRNLEHEAHTPITGITSMGQVLWENYDKLSDLQKRQAAAEIAKSSERLTSLVDNLIDLSKLQNLKYELNKTSVDLTSLVYNRLEICKKLYIQKEKRQNLTFDLKIEEKLKTLCDEYYIARTIDNIIINAIQYSKEGNITLTLRKTKSGDGVEFRVKDEGIGISQNEIFDVFGAFVTSSKTKTPSGGRGIGLALCKKVIELHEGKIWVEPNQTKGVTFIFTLPDEL